jgi:hypothetical protein
MTKGPPIAEPHPAALLTLLGVDESEGQVRSALVALDGGAWSWLVAAADDHAGAPPFLRARPPSLLDRRAVVQVGPLIDVAAAWHNETARRATCLPRATEWAPVHGVRWCREPPASTCAVFGARG